MKKTLKLVCMALAMGLMTSCGTQSVSDKVYNQGINLIPTPVSLTQQEGKFELTSSAAFKASTPEAKGVAEFFANKLKTSTGFDLAISETSGNIAINVDPALEMNAEGYKLVVTPAGIEINAKTGAGAFYGMQTVLQLLPAEVESKSVEDRLDHALCNYRRCSTFRLPWCAPRPMPSLPDCRRSEETIGRNGYAQD